MTERATLTAAPRDALSALRVLPSFKPFSDEELRELASLCDIRKARKGETLIREGEESDNIVYFLLTGEVSVYVGGNFILTLHRTGDIFGEMGLISDEPRSATVQTSKACTLLAVNAALRIDPGEADYNRFRYYFSRMFNMILTDKVRITSERARMYEDAVLQTRQAKEQSSGLQEQIRQNLQQIRVYSHLVESAKDAILILNTAGQVLEANPSVGSELGVAPSSVVGKRLPDLLAMPKAGEGSWAWVAKQACVGGWSGEVTLRAGSGAVVPADCSISSVEDADNRLQAFSVILRNITQRKAYEEKILAQSRELEKAYGELVEMDRLKDNFLTLVSHELRTPVTAIIAYAETLTIEGMVEPEEQGEFLHTIHAEALKLSALVNKVLTISKIESGQMHFEFQEGRLDELARVVANAMRPQADEKKLKLKVDVPDEFRPTRFDPDQMQEVLRQILDNAIRFTEKGAVTLKVSQQPKESLIEIKDTGKGMEDKFLNGAFTKFDWVENIQHHQSGIGLGLPLSSLIVTAHSGAMRMASRVGKGTTVTLSLPDMPEAETARPH